MKKTKSKIYLKPIGGLCNRMRAIDSSITLASELEKDLVVFWGRDKYINYRFSELFKKSEYFKVIEENIYFRKKAIFPYLPGSRPTSLLRNSFYKFTKTTLGIENELWFEDLDSALLPITSAVKPQTIKSMKDFEKQTYPYIAPLLSSVKKVNNSFVCSAWRLCPGQNYRKHFIPLEALNKKVTEVATAFDQTVGVHIRRTDHTEAVQYSSLAKFIKAMDNELQEDKNTTFFLATDCPKTERELKSLYPARVITFSKASYNRNSSQGIQDALVDLFCLSKTKKVLGSYYSSFSQVAAELSNIEEVSII